MATIVLVHGIAQEQETADSLELKWLPYLAGGVRKAEYPDVADDIWRHQRPGRIESRMALYGHHFLRPDQQGIDPGDLNADEQNTAERLALEWLERAASRAPRPKEKKIASRELAHVRGQVGEDVQGRLRGGFRSAIGSLARVPWFGKLGMAVAERFVAKALSQVTRYLSDDGIREKAQKAVLELIDEDTKVVIGHSLGSVVAYEVTHRLRDDLPLLVTLGSPLGLETIIYQRLRPQPPIYPPKVKRWVNVADTDDLVAAEPDLRRMFSAAIPADAEFESDHTVDNGAEPHNAQFYLGKARVGKPVGEILAR